MRLRVLVPNEVLVDTEATKIVAEAENGSFCLLPRHVDFVAALVPGVLGYVPVGEDEQFLAVDAGILVKCGPAVLVSTRNAVRGAPLADLRQAIDRAFRRVDEREQAARAAMAKVEADILRTFIRMGESARV